MRVCTGEDSQLEGIHPELFFQNLQTPKKTMGPVWPRFWQKMMIRSQNRGHRSQS